MEKSLWQNTMTRQDYPRSIWEVPSFDHEEMRPRKQDYAVAVFVLNEGMRLHNQLERMSAAKIASVVDIVIADGGSNDDTCEREVLERHDVSALLSKTGPGKLGAQMRMAFAWALDRGYRGLVVIDGNNKDGVEAIPQFVTQLQAGFDHVQGSRFIPGGHHENTPPARYWGVKLLHAPLLRFASGFAYTDTTNGFRAYSRALLTDPRIAVFRDELSHYELHYYLAYCAARLGFRCLEIPVSRVYPKAGKTPTKISAVSGNLGVLQRLLLTCLGHYGPNQRTAGSR